MLSTRYSSQIVMKLAFSRQFFKKKAIENFTKIRPVGRTERYDEGNSRFSQVCERV